MLNDPQAWMMLLGITPPIVVTILIAAWLNNRRIDSIDRRVDSLDASLNKRIDNLDASLNKRIDDLDGSLSKRVESLDISVNQRIDTVNSALNHRIDDLRTEIAQFRVEVMPVLREILTTLKDLDRRVTILEERSTPVVRS